MKQAKTKDDLFNWNNRKQKKKAKEDKNKARKVKKFSELNASEKDELLKDVAIQMGMIDGD